MHENNKRNAMLTKRMKKNAEKELNYSRGGTVSSQGDVQKIVKEKKLGLRNPNRAGSVLLNGSGSRLL